MTQREAGLRPGFYTERDGRLCRLEPDPEHPFACREVPVEGPEAERFLAGVRETAARWWTEQMRRER